jgi:hypothetical protein
LLAPPSRPSVREELNGAEEHGRKWWKSTLYLIEMGHKNTFEEVYCSREEGLVCMEREGKCKKCGDDGVIMKDYWLMEVCGLWDGDGDRGGQKNGTEEKTDAPRPAPPPPTNLLLALRRTESRTLSLQSFPESSSQQFRRVSGAGQGEIEFIRVQHPQNIPLPAIPIFVKKRIFLT